MNIKSYRKSLIITLALQALFLILWFVPMVRYSVAAMSYGGTDSFADCFEGASALFAFFLIFHIVAMICVAFPLIRRNLDKHRRFITPKISIFLTTAMWLFTVSSVKDWKNEYSDYGAQCSFTFGGWLLLITMVILVVMPFLLSYQSKAICERREKADFVRNAYAVRDDPTKEPIPEGGWRCSCGRANAAYVSSCTCGLSKASAQQQID